MLWEQYFWLGRKYRIVMWDLVTRDYSKWLTAEDVLKNVKRYTRNGSIITFHDSLKSIDKLRYALPEALKWLKEQGYEFKLSSETIKAEARNLAFCLWHSKAEPVEAEEAARFAAWLGRKGHAGMDYMAANVDKRLNPQLLMPGVKSIVCVALSYAPSSRIPADEPQLAGLCPGPRLSLHNERQAAQAGSTLGLTERTDNNATLAATLPKADKPCSANAASQSSLGSSPNNLPVHNQKSNQNFQFSILNSQIPTFRAFCDTAPVLERYWAMKAGLGWIGRNHQLIIPHAGSMFFLGELFVDAELEYDTPLPSRCGNCHACTDACPTGACI